MNIIVAREFVRKHKDNHSSPMCYVFSTEENMNQGLHAGTLVIHCGTGTRQGYKGVVYRRNRASDSKSVYVQWLFDAKGRPITGDISQQYTRRWSYNNMKLVLDHEPVKHIPAGIMPVMMSGTEMGSDHIANMHVAEKELIKGEKELIEESKPKDNGQFILWSPSGTYSPKVVHNSVEEAEHAAVDMAARHQKEFFICQLIQKAKPIYSATLEKL